MTDTIGIIGLGSAGQRHARNALAMGLEVIGFDPRFVGIGMNSPDIPSDIWPLPSIEVMLQKNLLGVIIATPPDTHATYCDMATEHDLPVLIEKPIATSRQEFSVMRASDKIAVGYQFRHIPQLRKLKADVDAGKYGTIFLAHVELSTDKWYSGTYKADFLLEASHELDLARWFCGTPLLTVSSVYTNRACALIDFDSGADVTVHLDGISPDYRRRLVLYGTKGSVAWCFDHDENEAAYRLELEDFVRVCRGEKAQPECTMEDGWWALRIVEAVKKSAESGQWETV